MGTKIDEYKKHLLDIMDSMPDDACGDWRDSLAYAIETMRKYQKIEQIAREGKNETRCEEIVRIIDGKAWIDR